MGNSPEVEDTLRRLNMPLKHSSSVVSDTPSNLGMLNKVADYVTWGEVTKESLVALLEKRGRLPGERRLTEEALKTSKLGSFEELAARILETGTIPPPLKKTFRLTPPSGGYKGGITRHVKSGGELGYRGSAINDLLQKML